MKLTKEKLTEIVKQELKEFTTSVGGTAKTKRHVAAKKSRATAAVDTEKTGRDYEASEKAWYDADVSHSKKADAYSSADKEFGIKNKAYTTAADDYRVKSGTYDTAQTAFNTADTNYSTALAGYTKVKKDYDKHQTVQPIATVGGRYEPVGPKQVGRPATFVSTDGRRSAYSSDERAPRPRGFGNWEPHDVWRRWDLDNRQKTDKLGVATSDRDAKLATRTSAASTRDSALTARDRAGVTRTAAGSARDAAGVKRTAASDEKATAFDKLTTTTASKRNLDKLFKAAQRRFADASTYFQGGGGKEKSGGIDFGSAATGKPLGGGAAARGGRGGKVSKSSGKGRSKGRKGRKKGKKRNDEVFQSINKILSEMKNIEKYR